MERAFHLPGLESVRTRPVAFGQRALAVAELSSLEMRSLLANLRGRADLRGPMERAQAVAEAAERFLDRHDPLRSRALDALPAVTGFSPSMMDFALPLVFAPLADRKALAATAKGADEVFRLVGVVAAGNIPGVALRKTALALTAGSSCVVKAAAGEPVLAALFAEALADVDPLLASSLAVVWWPGGSASCEDEFLRGVDSLVAYGSDEAISALRTRAADRLVGFGHKFSIALARLDRPADCGTLALEAARDVALYDQLGCLSPQTLYTVGGDAVRRRELVDRLAEALEDESRRWPRSEPPEESAIAIQRARDDYEWRELAGERAAMRSGRDWTILDDPSPGLRPSPLYRTLHVSHLESIEELAWAVGEWLPRLESVGIGPWPDPEAGMLLAALGVPRVAPLGRMQSAGLEWRQGGLHPMAGIIAGKGR